MERHEQQPAVIHSRGAALVAGSAFMALSGVVLNTLPIVLGAAADSLKLSNLEVGYLGSAYLAGFAGTPLLAPLWIRRISWRVALALGILVLVLSSVWAASTRSFSELAVALFVTGTGAGVLFSVAVTALGESAERERAFVASETTSLLLAAVAVWTLPTLIIPKYGFPGVAWSLAAATAAIALLLKWHPRASVRVLTASRSAQRTAARFPVFLGLIGIGFYHVGLAGLWSLLERIGRDHQISAQHVSGAFSLEKVLVLVVCAVAYCQGARLGHRLPVLIGCTGMLVSAAILYQVNGELGYIVGVCLFGEVSG
jgi:MFS family permease